MNPRRFLYLLLVCFLTCPLAAQDGLRLPVSTHGDDWHLDVSDVHTTTLIFPHDVVSVDRGTADVLTQTLDEVTNIVKVKSASETMEPSSLTVITSGGMVYTFRVAYTRNPATLTYHLAPLRSPDKQLAPAYRPAQPTVVPMSYLPARPESAPGLELVATPTVYYPAAVGADPEAVGTPTSLNMHPLALDSTDNPMSMNYGRTVINTESLWTASSRIHDTRTDGAVATDRGSGSDLALNDIWIIDDIMFYRFTLSCTSNVSYDIDFWRFYVIDAKQTKRTAVQERDVDLLQVYTAGQEPSHIGSHQLRTFVVAVDKFTIPDKQRLVLEVFEANGGRHHSLKIKNKDIVGARLVSPSPINQVK